jgi:hypothetical protein
VKRVCLRPRRDARDAPRATRRPPHARCPQATRCPPHHAPCFTWARFTAAPAGDATRRREAAMRECRKRLDARSGVQKELDSGTLEMQLCGFRLATRTHPPHATHAHDHAAAALVRSPDAQAKGGARWQAGGRGAEAAAERHVGGARDAAVA